MSTSSDLHLLGRATEALLEIAQFYVSDNEYAARARRKAKARSRKQLGHQAFHAAVLAHLASLHSALRPDQMKSDIDDPENGEIVKETLQVYEDLVDDDDENDEIVSYPGVQRLIDRYDSDKTETARIRPLGYRMCLFCPSLAIQDRLNNQLERCFVALTVSTGTMHSRARIDSGSLLADIERLKEWKPPPNMTRQAERLHKVLVMHLDCSCGVRHNGAKATPFPMRMEGAGVPCHLLGYPLVANSSALAHLVQLQLNSLPDEVTPSYQSASKIRFVLPDRPCESPTSGVQEPKMLHGICDAFTSTEPFSCLLINENAVKGIRSTAKSKPLDGPEVRRIASLRTSLADSGLLALQQVSKKERIVLGVVLSYLFLHLCNTPWWPNSNINPDVWFLRTAKSQMLQVRRPLVSIETSTLDRNTKFSVEGFMNSQRPCLPAFGKLLLEVWRGTVIEWADLDTVIHECSEDYVGSYWLCAVNACLGGEPTLREAGDLRQSSRLRSIFVHKVIKSLQWLLENLCRFKVEDIFNMPADIKSEPQVISTLEVYNPKPETRRVGVLSRSTLMNGPKRLINTENLQIEEISDGDTWPVYAILSHRWTAAEVSYKDWQSATKEDSIGWSKIRGACRQAIKDGIAYLWVDSCCINKDSNYELNEALNSMYRWYSEAKVCYIHLSDVRWFCALPGADSSAGRLTAARMMNEMTRSEWFTRGWTLQELLAPQRAIFFSADWKPIGERGNLTSLLSYITQIDPEVLEGTKRIADCSVAQRFSWAAYRKTTKEEDRSYSLLGLFNVSLEAKYGIGQLAFEELQKKILDSGLADDSLFAWDSSEAQTTRRFFAASPSYYQDCNDIVCVRPRRLKTYLSCRSDGVGGRIALYQCQEHLDGWEGKSAILNCMRMHQPNSLLALRLEETSEQQGPADLVVTTGAVRGGNATRSRLIQISQRRIVGAVLTETSIDTGKNFGPKKAS